MSEHSSDSSVGIAFDERTTNANFQERLLQAKSSTPFDPSNNEARFTDFYYSDDTASLKEQLERLSSKVEYMENRVIEKENKLATRRQNRNTEASITNMTTEQRAAYVVEQEQKHAKEKKKRLELRNSILRKELKKYVGDGQDEEDDQNEQEEQEEREEQDEQPEDEKPDWNIVYEYLLLLEAESTDDDLTFGPDFMNLNTEMRQKAFDSEQVKRQTDYSGIVIKSATHSFQDNKEADAGEVRHCVLLGAASDIPFKVEFDVLEPSMIMPNLDFDVNIEMQLAVGNTLQKIKNECNIMGFFQLLVHYAKLENARRQVFDQLISHFKDTPVNVVLLSPSKLQFEGAADCDINLLLLWNIVEVHADRKKLDADIKNEVVPRLTMEAVALPAVIEKDTNKALEKVNEAFMYTILQQGVYEGIKSTVDIILSD